MLFLFLQNMNLNLKVPTQTDYPNLVQFQKNRLNRILHQKQLTGEFRTTRFYYENAKKGRFADILGDSEGFANQMDSVITVLNNKMGNKWDIILEPYFGAVLNPDSSTHSWVYKGFQIWVVLHYPLITIRNADEESRELKDLLVAFKLRSNGLATEQLTISEIYGCRATLDYEEWFTQYNHSHLGIWQPQEYNQCFFFKSFCLGGETEINSLMMEMLDEGYVYSDIVFESFLYAIDSVVEWESLEGNPYIYMRNCTVASNQNTVDRKLREGDLTDYYHHILMDITPEMFDSLNFTYSKGRYRFQIDDTFINLFKDSIDSTSFKSTLLVKEVNGNLLGFSRPSILEEETLLTKFLNNEGEQPSISIQGNEIQFKVLPYAQEVESITGYDIHPNFLEYAIQQLEQQLFYKSVRKSTIERYYQGSNA